MAFAEDDDDDEDEDEDEDVPSLCGTCIVKRDWERELTKDPTTKSGGRSGGAPSNVVAPFAGIVPLLDFLCNANAMTNADARVIKAAACVVGYGAFELFVVITMMMMTIWYCT
jgi:hypothetical protein